MQFIARIYFLQISFSNTGNLYFVYGFKPRRDVSMCANISFLRNLMCSYNLLFYPHSVPFFVPNDIWLNVVKCSLKFCNSSLILITLLLSFLLFALLQPSAEKKAPLRSAFFSADGNKNSFI